MVPGRLEQFLGRLHLDLFQVALLTQDFFDALIIKNLVLLLLLLKLPLGVCILVHLFFQGISLLSFLALVNLPLSFIADVLGTVVYSVVVSELSQVGFLPIFVQLGMFDELLAIDDHLVPLGLLSLFGHLLPRLYIVNQLFLLPMILLLFYTQALLVSQQGQLHAVLHRCPVQLANVVNRLVATPYHRIRGRGVLLCWTSLVACLSSRKKGHWCLIPSTFFDLGIPGFFQPLCQLVVTIDCHSFTVVGEVRHMPFFQF